MNSEVTGAVAADRAAFRPTIKDVARVAGLSFKTVSRVLNDEPDVRDETRARVTSAISLLGYPRNEAAAELRRPRRNHEV